MDDKPRGPMFDRSVAELPYYCTVCDDYHRLSYYSSEGTSHERLGAYVIVDHHHNNKTTYTNELPSQQELDTAQRARDEHRPRRP